MDKGYRQNGYLPTAKPTRVRCAVCGGGIDAKNPMTREHVFPKAIYKWGERLWTHQDYNRYYTLIESGRNIVYSHIKCNSRKGDDIPKLKALVISESRKKELTVLQKELSSAIDTFEGLKERIRKKQNGKCFCCGKVLMESDEGIIRRINTDRQRIESNACVVCSNCSRENADFILL